MKQKIRLSRFGERRDFRNYSTFPTKEKSGWKIFAITSDHLPLSKLWRRGYKISVLNRNGFLKGAFLAATPLSEYVVLLLLHSPYSKGDTALVRVGAGAPPPAAPVVDLAEDGVGGWTVLVRRRRRGRRRRGSATAAEAWLAPGLLPTGEAVGGGVVAGAAAAHWVAV